MEPLYQVRITSYKGQDMHGMSVPGDNGKPWVGPYTEAHKLLTDLQDRNPGGVYILFPNPEEPSTAWQRLMLDD